MEQDQNLDTWEKILKVEYCVSLKMRLSILMMNIYGVNKRGKPPKESVCMLLLLKGCNV